MLNTFAGQKLVLRLRCEELRKTLGDNGTALRIEYDQSGNKQLSQLVVCMRDHGVEIHDSDGRAIDMSELLGSMIRQCCACEVRQEYSTMSSLLTQMHRVMSLVESGLVRAQGRDDEWQAANPLQDALDYVTNACMAIAKTQECLASQQHTRH